MLQGSDRLSDDGEMFVSGIRFTDLGMMPWDDLLGPILRRLTNQ